MTRERLQAIVAAYGADPRRWPDAERARAQALIAGNPDVQALLAQEAEANRILDALGPEIPSASLSARILSAFDATHRPVPRGMVQRIRDAVWPGAPLWQPASALVFSLIVGIVVGAALPEAVDGHEMSEQATMLPIDAPSAVDLDHGG